MSETMMSTDVVSNWSEEKTNAAVEEITQNGYTVLRDIIPPEMLGRLQQKTGQLIDEEVEKVSRLGKGKEMWRSLHRLRNVVALDPLFRDAVLFEPIARITEKLLGRGFILFASAVNEVGPGAVPMRLHVDDLLLKLPRPLARPLMLNSLWALTPFTTANGGTRLIPGSHRQEMNEPDEALTIQPAMDEGSILLYLGSVVHGAGRNTTEASWRRAMIFTYCCGFIRPFESPLKTIPLAEFRNMSPELRQLLSYDYYTDETLPRLY
jgi:ectoine hydroxylase-related dioxygenase (phytanoyl-CoA dioxygenase family)